MLTHRAMGRSRGYAAAHENSQHKHHHFPRPCHSQTKGREEKTATFLQAPVYLLKCILFFLFPSFSLFPSIWTQHKGELFAKRTSSETQSHRKAWTTNIPLWEVICLQV